MKKKILLVKCSTNWADEMDLDGFALIEAQAWKEHLDLVEANIFKGEVLDDYDEFGPNAVGVGTNESVFYESLDVYKNTFTTKELSDAEVETLASLFKLKVTTTAKDVGRSTYGFFVELNPYNLEE